MSVFDPAFVAFILETPAVYTYFTVLAFWFGACMGSFLNVCIFRIPEELSVVAPASRCPSCETPIKWYDNIPILSWLALRAKCRACGVKISARYVTVELLVGLLFMLTWLKFGYPPRALHVVPTLELSHVAVFWLVIFGLTLATFVDLDHYIIPDRCSKGGMVLGVLCTALVPTLHLLPWETAITLKDAMMRSGIGLLFGFGLLYGVGKLGSWIYKKDAMGFGDVKLMGAIGAFFGWRGVLFVLVGASFLGAFIGLSMVAMGKKEMQGRIPFGPYLALATICWIFWGPMAWAAYRAALLRPYLEGGGL